MKIQVLMSSYNGEKYIEEQIESILNQEGVELSLLIRDDGSKDGTRRILEQVQKNDTRVKCVFEENIGVKKSFLKLVQMADPSADYYAFSDQDDIWLNEKMAVAVSMLQKENPDNPLIYGSSVSLYIDGQTTGRRFVCQQLDLGRFLIKNYYPGCTMVFNRKMKNLVEAVDYDSLQPNPLHDHWLNLICTACGGKVVMDPEPHMLYRQHGGNEVGDRGLIQRIKENGLLTHSDNTRLKICKELHMLYREHETEESSKLIQIVLDSEKGFSNKMKLAFNNKIKPITVSERISIFLIALMGKF